MSKTVERNIRDKSLKLTIEYVIVIRNTGSYCETSDDFCKLLELDKNISIEKNKIKSTISDRELNIIVDFSLKSGTIISKKQRYFNLKLILFNSESIDALSKLARKIRLIAEKIDPNNVEINTIRDDIGSFYAVLAYPLIHEVENTMRSLISKFMIINVGVSWVNEAIHIDLKQKSKSDKRSITNFIQNIDFIDLSDVLFKSYRKNEIAAIDHHISAINKTEDIDIEFLKDGIPKSNWERYFSDLIPIKEIDLKNNWEKLYDIRNDVAHNRYISKERYQELESILNKVTPHLDSVLEKLDQLELGIEDIELVSKTVTEVKSVSLIKVIKMLNIGMATAVDALRSSGYQAEKSPMLKLTQEMVNELFKRFKPDFTYTV